MNRTNNPPHNKPVARLSQFAALLGWSPLRVYQHTLDDRSTENSTSIITWYESEENISPHTDCFLQINEHPIGQTHTYNAAVYAIRYRICTGWHQFTLHKSKRDQAAEAERIGQWLHKDWFTTLAKRREFRQLYPQCTGYSWKKIREVGPPELD
ncbi:MAG: hypothetical protein COA78_38740 [Blastopirellula sp.]|nr:MAG: hypothetical protein COA78_38740 [Blastopirellula sp.]